MKSALHQITLLMALLAGAACLSFGQDVPSSRPLLEQFDRESRALYSQVQLGVVRVQLPPPIWLREIASRDNPIYKWAPELDEQVKQKLLEESKNVNAGNFTRVSVELLSTSRPINATTQPDTLTAVNATS